jgi:NADPH-dependent curcumin reductase CurA
MQGFLATDFAQRYEDAIAELASWIRDAKLQYREDLLQRIEAAPSSIERFYSDANRGKLVIRL